MFQKIMILFLLVSFKSISWAWAQNCTITIKGYLKELNTGNPISDANLILDKTKQGTTSNSNGFFQLQALCANTYHLTISHVNCETKRIFLDLRKDTVLQIMMNHYSQVLDDVVITEKSEETTLQTKQTISDQQIRDNAQRNLSNLLENMTGVHTLRNGNSIAKPVVHGLYGNRLLILNNGITQSGQQWGNDHSPEIDPLAANQITVVKGVSALEYQGSSLGSVILVEPKKIEKEPHGHGKITYFFESNGLGNGLNAQWQKSYQKWAWKLTGTLKKSGDRRSADYFLRNTGSQEANMALQIEKYHHERWTSELYFSSFNTELGVLRGSHIGNLTDLKEAFGRAVPFFTEDQFTYRLDAPYQRVHHQLLKLRSQYFLTENQWFEITYALQWNLRKEFDVRRSGRSEIPALSLSQLSNFGEVKYNTYLRPSLKLKTGLQFNLIDNTNNPETGILPLIPDYLSYETGIFAVLNPKWERLSVEIGARYDYINRRVAAISQTLPREVLRYHNLFHNLSASGSAVFRLSRLLNLNYSLGLATRNPAVNELYSNGLHQGVSGIEEGTANLESEKSIKTTLGLEGQLTEKWFIDFLAYYQHIRGYIFLKPQEEIRLTIRGAFPVFRYEQTDAQIGGFDLSTTYYWLKNLKTTVQYSYLRGHDLRLDVPLVFMPANRLVSRLHYEWAKVGRFENLELQLQYQYVFRQDRLLPNQDFALAPPAYSLVGLRIATQTMIGKNRLHVYTQFDNLLNVRYRDYLNRQRYFADDLGFNATVGISVGL